VSDRVSGKMRRATVTSFGSALRLSDDAEIPQPKGSEILVRVQRCGVCHTAVHVREGFYELGGGKRLQFADRGVVPPVTPGHEIYGEIVATGPQGEGIGRRGLVYPYVGCGRCAVCQVGDEHMCPDHHYLGLRAPGGYGEYVLLPHARYLLDTGDLKPSEAATLACAGVTAYSALRKLDPGSKSGWLGVIGAGGLGLMAISLGRALGFDRIVAFEPNEQHRQAALSAGACRAMDSRNPNALATAQKEMGGGAASMIDFVGIPETFNFGTDALRRGGRYVLVGLHGGEATISLPLIPLRAISIIGTVAGSIPEMTELVALVRTGVLPDLPVSEFGLQDANVALDKLEAGEVVGRLVLVP